MVDVHTIVVGAGVVGLAIAARLSAKHEVMVLEREATIGQGISSRNSEVIHAGIYYQTPLKARLCVRGKEMLYEYCLQRSIPHRQTGKLIVATNPDEVSQLEKIQQQAATNGVLDIQPLDQKQLRSREPNVFGQCGLLSPSSGIVSSHDLMNSLAGDVTNNGGQIVTHCLAERFEVDRAKSLNFTVQCRVEQDEYKISCQNLIVAAGFGSHNLLGNSESFEARVNVPKLHLCKGRYFSYSGKAPFQHLIYPVPDPNMVGLGIHATLDLAGQVKFGPDTEYVAELDYSLPEIVPDAYIDAIRRYFPSLNPAALKPDYSGIRPKIAGPGEQARDFVIEGPEHHQLDGYVQLFGIESPGLTSSLAIAEHVEGLL